MTTSFRLVVPVVFLLIVLCTATIRRVSAATTSISTGATAAPSATIYAEEFAVIVIGYSVLILVILTKYRSR